VSDVLIADPAEPMPEEPQSEAAAIVLDQVARRRARVLSVITVVIGLAAVVFFGRAVGDATFVLNPVREDTLPDVVVPGGTTALVLGLIAIALGVVGWVKGSPKLATGLLAAGMGLFVVAMLVWATAEATNPTTTVVGLLAGTLRRASPLALGALAGVLCERAGVVNIAIEGKLLGGAFAGAVIGSATDSLLFGLLGGVAVGVLLASILAVMSIRFRVDQVVGGTFINIFALGLTTFLAKGVLQEHQDLNDPPTFTAFGIPGLEDIPVLGPVVFDNTFHVYAALVLVPVLAIALYRTRWGLRLRACGEHPKAADSVGIDVKRTRFRAVMLGGAVAGLGGTFFSLDSAGSFQDNMTAGRGFIALAALIFGRWHPVGALGAALVFGFAEEFANRLGVLGSDIPSQFLLMAPYLVTLVVVAGLIGRARPPAADGVPFER
jgi:simple sugar transport system permease protein